jgi:1,4-alpha-glucan branching enzyme
MNALFDKPNIVANVDKREAVRGDGAPGLAYAKPTKPINFYCTAPEAQSVCLMGDFNGWNPTSHPMEQRRDGWWFLQVQLTHGHHQYLFVVDGTPTLDPHATGAARNERYAKVSLIAVS